METNSFKVEKNNLGPQDISMCCISLFQLLIEAQGSVFFHGLCHHAEIIQHDWMLVLILFTFLSKIESDIFSGHGNVEVLQTELQLKLWL